MCGVCVCGCCLLLSLFFGGGAIQFNICLCEFAGIVDQTFIER